MEITLSCSYPGSISAATHDRENIAEDLFILAHEFLEKFDLFNFVDDFLLGFPVVNGYLPVERSPHDFSIHGGTVLTNDEAVHLLLLEFSDEFSFLKSGIIFRRKFHIFENHLKLLTKNSCFWSYKYFATILSTVLRQFYNFGKIEHNFRM